MKWSQICVLVFFTMPLVTNTFFQEHLPYPHENGCLYLQHNPRSWQRNAANRYCENVLNRVVNNYKFDHKLCPGVKNAKCSKRCILEFSGLENVCTVEIRKTMKIGAVLCRTSIRVILSSCYKGEWKERTGNVAVYAIRGNRLEMEDRFVINENIVPGVSVFAVFDGHSGELAVNFARSRLMEDLSRKITSLHKLTRGSSKHASKSTDLEGYLTTQGAINYVQVMHEVILLTDEALLAEERKFEGPENINYRSGSTALIALIALIEGSTLYVANVGDSRGVMCDSQGQMKELSIDHKPGRACERERIEAAGGFVAPTAAYPNSRTLRTNGHISISRALGALNLKEQGVLTANPEILTFDLSKHKPQFMILATDGLWDKIRNEEAVNFVGRELRKPDFGAKRLTEIAYARGSSDNMTVMVINLSKIIWPSQ